MTQKDLILKHLASGSTITPLEAVGVYGCFRLAAVVHALKKEGYRIRATMQQDPVGKKYAKYSMVFR